MPSDLVEFEFADFKVANTGFKPLVREAKFDLGELAIVTYLQAKAYNKPYVLIPAVVVARAQHHTIAYNSERGELKPADLAGKRVGVRAYSVTTGVWVRGILQQQFGVDLDKVHWVTFEDPHVAEYNDPSFVERAPAGKNMVQMLLDGELDAAVVGDKLPDPRLKTLIPDVEAAAKAWASQARQSDQPYAGDPQRTVEHPPRCCARSVPHLQGEPRHCSSWRQQERGAAELRSRGQSAGPRGDHQPYL